MNVRKSLAKRLTAVGRLTRLAAITVLVSVGLLGVTGGVAHASLW